MSNISKIAQMRGIVDTAIVHLIVQESIAALAVNSTVDPVDREMLIHNAVDKHAVAHVARKDMTHAK